MPTNAAPIPLEIVLVALVEFLFGLGYNALVVWAFRHRLMHVSLSVVIGVAVTLLIPTVVWFDHPMPFWQCGGLLLICFAASGTPMIVGSTRRTVNNKRRRPWPNSALRAKEDAVMELSAMAHEIAGKAKANQLTLQDLPDYVNRLHGVIGILKSV